MVGFRAGGRVVEVRVRGSVVEWLEVGDTSPRATDNGR